MTELILLISPMALRSRLPPRLQPRIQVVDIAGTVEREAVLCVDAAAAVGDIATRKLHVVPADNAAVMQGDIFGDRYVSGP